MIAPRIGLPVVTLFVTRLSAAVALTSRALASLADKFGVLATVALATLACAPPPRITPEDATQRFTTTASVTEVLDAAVTALESSDFSIVDSGDTFVCGERGYREFSDYRAYDQACGRHGAGCIEGNTSEWKSQSGFRLTLVRISAAGENDGTLVTIVPSGPSCLSYSESGEYRRSWCQESRRLLYGDRYSLGKDKLALGKDLATMIKEALGEEGSQDGQ